MAVDLTKLDKYVRQAIESESETAKHDTGFRVTDLTTGKKYRYVQLGGGVAGVLNYPCGMYVTSDDPNVITCDKTDHAAANPCGLMMGAITDTYYCWIQERDPAMPTDALTGTVNAVGDLLLWTADGFLTTVAAGTVTTDDLHACAVALETGASVTATKIQWL